MDALIDVDPMSPAPAAAGMILTLIVDLLQVRTNPMLGPIFGYLANGVGPANGLTRGFQMDAGMVAIAIFPLLVAEVVVLAVMLAVNAKRRPLRSQHSREPSTSRSTTRLKCRPGTC